MRKQTSRIVCVLAFLLGSLGEGKDVGSQNALPPQNRIGFDLVRSPLQTQPSKSRVTVAQIEAGGGRVDENLPIFQNKEFSSISGGNPNSHATAVGSIFYGKSRDYSGVAPGLKQIIFGEAGSFLKEYIQINKALDVRIINQSYSLAQNNPVVDAMLDRYAERQNVLFINGANGMTNMLRNTPSSMSNGICVDGCDAVSGIPSCGLTPSIQRKAPDLVAPTSAAYYFLGPPPVLTNSVVGLIGTSMSAPFVSGAAARVMDVALQKDVTVQGADPRVVKAVLMTSAQKTKDWSADPESSLDSRFGAGILDVESALEIMRSGPPLPGEGQVTGWDLGKLGGGEERRYPFRLSKAIPCFTATLVCYRHVENNRIFLVPLNFKLMRANGTTVADYMGPPTPVVQLHVTDLAEGDYVLGVECKAPMGETYGVAWWGRRPS